MDKLCEWTTSLLKNTHGGGQRLERGTNTYSMFIFRYIRILTSLPGALYIWATGSFRESFIELFDPKNNNPRVDKINIIIWGVIILFFVVKNNW